MILAPKGTKSLNEDRQEEKSTRSQEVSCSVESGQRMNRRARGRGRSGWRSSEAVGETR